MDDGEATADMELVELVELLELLDEVLLSRCCKGSAAGRWAAAVCSWRRREASGGPDICSGGGRRKANSGFDGSAGVSGANSEIGEQLGVSMEKWAASEGTMLK